MAEYDNTNSGAVFKPFETMKMILQGKVNLEGNERKIVLVADKTKQDKKIIEVYQKVAVLFEDDKGNNEQRPDYSGLVEDYATDKNMRIAAWKRVKGDNKYMSLSISEKQSKGGNGLNDEIPF